MITSMTMRYFLVSGSLHLIGATKKKQIKYTASMVISGMTFFGVSVNSINMG